MRNITLFLMAVVFAAAMLPAVPAGAQTPPPPPPGEKWFDMEHCAMCRPLIEAPELLHNMSWEQHDIKNGIVSVTTVREPFMKKFKEAQAKMGAVAAKMQAGEQVELCPSCVAFGQFIMHGATVEQVDTMHGSLMIVTGDTPELVGEIQAWAQRTRDEMKKMEEMEKKMKKEKQKEMKKQPKQE